jgi:transposase InsO family protein
VLYRYSQDNDEEAAQLLVPDHERTRVLKQYHDSPTAGHYVIERTYHRIQQRYYWPGIRRYIADYLKTCHECQRYKPHNLKPAGLLQTPVLQQRMEVIAIDLFGPLPPASTGERWILIIEDYATRWIELFALVDATADRCAWTFVNEVCLRYGIPRKLISDNGTQFISAIMQKICFCLGISQAFTPVYHPEANPVERRNRDLKTQLAIQIRDKPHSDWPRQLSSIRFAMNTARSQSTGKTPAFLLFGSEIRSIDDVTNDLRGVILSENFVAEATPRLLRLHESWKEARETHEKEQDRRKQYADSKRRPTTPFQPGDLVYADLHVLSIAARGFSSKLAPRRDGPYIVLQQNGPTSYVLAARDKPAEPFGTYHVSQLTPYLESEDAAPKPIHPIKKRGRPRKNQVQ